MKEAETAYAHLARPFGSIDLDALDRNIAFVIQAARGKNVRIARKSIRSINILRYITKRLENPIGFMTFDLRETLYLLSKGFNDLHATRGTE